MNRPQHLVALLLVAALVGPPAVCAEPLPVVATFSILGDLVREVGGERVAVTVLVGPDADAHTFEPAPSDVVSVQRARRVFALGVGFDAWLEELAAQASASGRTIYLAQGLATRVVAGEPRSERETPGRRLETDPHIWHEVNRVLPLVTRIAEGLRSADPAGAAAYAAAAEDYRRKLEALEVFIRGRVAEVPPARRKLFTSHDTFGYFAEAYGFELLGSALGSVTTEQADPSARDLARVIDEIKAAGVPAIFGENVNQSKLGRQIAREARVALVDSLYTDALGEIGSAGDTYIKMMRHNVTVIVDALK